MDIVCVGQITADVVVNWTEEIPERGKSEFVERIQLHNGGCACNTAIDLAKIGTSVGIVGKVGTDGFGDFLISLMKDNGVNTTGIKRAARVNTSSTVVLVDPDGERRFLHYSGANAKLRIDDIDFEMIKGAKILHLAPIYLLPGLDRKSAAKLLKKAKEMGISTSLDTAWDAKNQWLDIIEQSLPYTDIFLPSLDEAKMISKKESLSDVAKFFLSYGIKIVGLKMGKKGCYIRTEKDEIRIPAFKVKAVDTTGAGDAFVAGFLTGMINGWDLELTGKFANAAGACCIMEVGAPQGTRPLEKILELMRKAEIQE